MAGNNTKPQTHSNLREGTCLQRSKINAAARYALSNCALVSIRGPGGVLTSLGGITRPRLGHREVGAFQAPEESFEGVGYLFGWYWWVQGESPKDMAARESR